jgi:two-component system cell cycle sensor histidine kinase/response regulator CckA
MMIAGILPLIIMFAVMHFVVRNAIHQSEKEKIAEISDQLARNVAAIMEGASNDLRSLATNPILSNSERTEAERLTEMQRLVSAYDSFSDISIYDPDGYLIDSTTEEEPIWREYSKWFKQAKVGETSISDPIASVDEETPLRLSVYLPIFGEAENVKNVVVARLSFQRVLSLLGSVRHGENGRAVLLNSFGRLICHPKKDEELLEKFNSRFKERFWNIEPRGVYVDSSGEAFLYYVVSIDPDQTRVGSTWYILSMKPMEEVNSLLHKTVTISVVSFILAVVVAGLLSAIYSRNLSKSIVSANIAASQVASGDLSARMEEEGPMELRSMAATFNVMVKELGEHRSKLEHLVRKRTASLQDSQERLANTMAQLHSAFDSTREAILLIDNNGVVVANNGLFCEFFGVDESRVESGHVAALQLTMAERCAEPKKFLHAWTQALVDDSLTVEFEYDIESPQARHLALYSAPVRADGGSVSGRLWTWRDLTEQRTLEQSLRQSQKMEAVGQLAGGVAHDFNNLLTGIVGNLALVEMELDGPEHERARRHIDMAVKAGGRAAELIKQLLGFSRRSHLKLRAAQANDVIEDVRDLLTASIDPKVKITATVDENAWAVMIDPNQLEQVVMNLCVNAKDALGANGGDILMSSRNVTINPGDEAVHIDAKPGEYLCLSVEDNGSGMPAEVQAKIFEPFFTTKEQGKGTGLGLATSFGIIKQLGGWIVCTSEVGEGTRFDIFLPKSTVALEEEKKQTNAALEESSAEATETLLLVDDEQMVRSVAEALLSKLGYDILVAADGEEALRIYAERADDIDLVMLDLTMPTLSGADTFRRLREEFDYVPVLICSGYLVDLTAFEAETGARPDGFVQKPYKMETMASTVREVINEARRAAA